MAKPDIAAVKIGDFIFKIQSKYPIVFDIGYFSFVTTDFDNPDILLQVEDLSAVHLQPVEFIFEAVEQDFPLWKVCKTANGYRLFLYNQLQKGTIQTLIDVPHQFDIWQIYCRPGLQGKVTPLAYPAGPLLLYMLAICNSAFIQHASAVISNGRAFVFSGFSGTGKSTMASIWRERGYTVINDDIVLIRKNSKGFMVYNTPMYYEDKPKQAPLAAVFLLQHSKENYMKPLKGAAISKFMRSSVQHAYDKRFLNTHLQLVQDIYKTVPIVEMGFKPHVSVIDFIHTHL